MLVQGSPHHGPCAPSLFLIFRYLHQLTKQRHDEICSILRPSLHLVVVDELALWSCAVTELISGAAVTSQLCFVLDQVFWIVTASVARVCGVASIVWLTEDERWIAKHGNSGNCSVVSGMILKRKAKMTYCC